MSCRDGPNDRVDLWRSLCISLLYFVLRVKKVHVRYISSADEFLVSQCMRLTDRQTDSFFIPR